MAESTHNSKRNIADLTKEELIEKCKNLLQIAQKAKAAKDESSKLIDQLRNDTAVLTEINEKLTSEKVNYVAEKDSLKRKLLQSEKNAESLTEKISVAESKVGDLSLKVTSLEKNLQSKNAALEDSLKKIEKLEIQNEGIKRSLTRVEDENDELLDQVAKLETDLATAKKESATLTNRIGHLEAENQERKATIICLEQKLKDKEKEISNQLKVEDEQKEKSHVGNDATLEKENQVLQDENVRLKSEVEAIHENLSKDVQLKTELLGKVSELENILEAKNQEIHSLTVGIQEKESEHAAAIKTVVAEKDELAQTCKEFESTKAHLKEALLAVRDKSEEVERLSNEINHFSATLEAKKNLSLEVQRLKDELMSLCDKKNEIDVENQELKSRLESQSEELEAVKNDYDTMKKCVEEKETNLAALSDEVSMLKRSYEISSSDQEHSVQEKESLVKDLSTKEIELCKIKEERDALENSAQHLEQRCRQLSVEVETLNEKCSDLEKTKQEFQEKIQNFEILKNSLQEAKQMELSKLSEEIEGLMEQSSEDERQRRQLEARIEMKEKEVEELQATLDSASKMLEDCKNDGENHMKTISSEFENRIEELSSQLASLSITLQGKEDTILHLRGEKSSLEKSLNDREEELHRIEIELQELKEILTAKESEVQLQNERIRELKMENQAQSEAFEALLQETTSIKGQLEGVVALKSEHEKTLSLLAAAERDLSTGDKQVLKFDALQSQIFALKNLASQLKVEATEITADNLSQIRDCSSIMNDLVAAFANWKTNFETELNSAKLHNGELIEDLNKMNIEIRSRGEKISHLSESNDTLSSKLEDLQTVVKGREEAISNLNLVIDQLRDAQSGRERDIDELKSRLSDKESDIEKLKASTVDLQGQLEAVEQARVSLEIEYKSSLVELKKKLEEREAELLKVSQQNQELETRTPNKSSAHLDESQSEVMSTSTISKAEETNRMADVESSFEERYGKLKLLAIKLKKKTVEQENKIIELEKSQRESGKLVQVMNNFTNLQAEYDTLQDKFENQALEMKSLSKDLEKSVEDCIKCKERLEDVESELKDKSAKLESISKEFADCQSQLTKLLHENQNHETNVKQLTASNKDLSEKVAQYILRVEQLTSSSKKHDLLDMELEEAETRIKNLTQSYEETLSKLENKEVELKLEAESRQNRETQISELESLLQKETDRAEDLRSKLAESRKFTSQLEDEQMKTKVKLDQVLKELDLKCVEVEKLQLQIADVSGNALSSAKSYQTRSDSLQKMVAALEADVERKNQRIQDLEGRLGSVEKEFENYKIRAQSVLRQAKDKDSHLNAKSQEISNLERIVSALNEKIQDLGTQHAAAELEKQHLQDDYERLMERHSALLQEMAAKEKAAREKIDQFKKKISEVEVSREAAITGCHQEMENIRQSYRSEIEALTSKSTAEVSRLQQQIDKLDNQIIRLQMSNRSPSVQNQSGHLPMSPHVSDVELSLLEREAAEGSESTDPHYQRGISLSPTVRSRFKSSDDLPQPLMPLDQLLLQKDEELTGPAISRQMSEVSTGGGTIQDQSWSESSAALENRASMAEKQVKHLALLLSESEAENARLVQLSQVLKEEIRSYRRSEERSKHIENLEYVKNVILKFLTLPESVERARLVPVLTTILKLSKEEVQKIETVVLAEPEASGNAEGGWSSYLGLWTP